MPLPNSNSLAVLAWLTDAGADEAIGEEAINRFAVSTMGQHRIAAGPNPALPGSGVARRESGTTDVWASRLLKAPGNAAVAPGTADSDQIGRAIDIASGCGTLAALKAALEVFDGCALKKHAQNTVFADGTPDRKIMFIGEAPGRDEDRAGLPFVGRAGKLLDKMLAAIDLDRKTNVYITNVLNWRPPENRDPSPEEAASCLPFLRRHIELVTPEVIVLLGAVSVRYVMGKNDGIMRLRGKWLEYFVGGRMIPVMPTLHPAYLLRRPVDKKLAWRDLQVIAGRIAALGLLEHGSTRG
jgi:DNA polymerase